VIHQYMRERFAGCGKMILGSDSHTRYGPLGTLGIGEGGGELVKQLLGNAYEIEWPEIIGVNLTGRPRPGAGPQDVALALIGAVFSEGLVKNKILEFTGDGLAWLDMDFRNALDVMTTETACLSSVWTTDGAAKEFLEAHGRPGDYRELAPQEGAYYDGLIEIDLAKIKPMIALPFHPSNAYEIDYFVANARDIANEQDKGRQPADFALSGALSDGELRFGQAIIAGCAGGLYGNIVEAAKILGEGKPGQIPFSVYPASQPVSLALIKDGVTPKLLSAGAIVKTAFCGPCFGAGDIPADGALSARHVTRNFPNREGSKPDKNQSAAVALMDARSIAATVKNGGRLTAAPEEAEAKKLKFYFHGEIYEKCVYDGFGKPDAKARLVKGPGIGDWPALGALPESLLLLVAAYIDDPVTTTDELIPSGETSSYRSNPEALAEYTLSRRCPGYVGRAKTAASLEQRRREGKLDIKVEGWLEEITNTLGATQKLDLAGLEIGSLVFAKKPGDGSAREQAASCQRVLGGRANIAVEYATKRYRSNLINWGMLPFAIDKAPPLAEGGWLYVPNVRGAVSSLADHIEAYGFEDGKMVAYELLLPGMTEEEAGIILRGGLINCFA